MPRDKSKRLNVASLFKELSAKPSLLNKQFRTKPDRYAEKYAPEEDDKPRARKSVLGALFARPSACKCGMCKSCEKQGHSASTNRPIKFQELALAEGPQWGVRESDESSSSGLSSASSASSEAASEPDLDAEPAAEPALGPEPSEDRNGATPDLPPHVAPDPDCEDLPTAPAGFFSDFWPGLSGVGFHPSDAESPRGPAAPACAVDGTPLVRPAAPRSPPPRQKGKRPAPRPDPSQVEGTAFYREFRKWARSNFGTAAEMVRALDCDGTGLVTLAGFGAVRSCGWRGGREQQLFRALSLGQPSFHAEDAAVLFGTPEAARKGKMLEWGDQVEQRLARTLQKLEGLAPAPPRRRSTQSPRPFHGILPPVQVR